MSLLRFIAFLRQHLRTVIYVSCGVLALVALADIFVDKHHAHTKAEHFPAFWSAFGFVACVLIVLASKAFGKAGIMQREDYYDE